MMVGTPCWISADQLSSTHLTFSFSIYTKHTFCAFKMKEATKESKYTKIYDKSNHREGWLLHFFQGNSDPVTQVAKRGMFRDIKQLFAQWLDICKSHVFKFKIIFQSQNTIKDLPWACGCCCSSPLSRSDMVQPFQYTDPKASFWTSWIIHYVTFCAGFVAVVAVSRFRGGQFESITKICKFQESNIERITEKRKYCKFPSRPFNRWKVMDRFVFCRGDCLISFRLARRISPTASNGKSTRSMEHNFTSPWTYIESETRLLKVAGPSIIVSLLISFFCKSRTWLCGTSVSDLSQYDSCLLMWQTRGSLSKTVLFCIKHISFLILILSPLSSPRSPCSEPTVQLSRPSASDIPDNKPHDHYCKREGWGG